MSQQQQPQPAPWTDSAHTVVGMHVSFPKAAVQFVGKHPLLLEEAAVTVPFATLFQLVGQLMSVLEQQYPALAILAASSADDAQLASELRARWLNGNGERATDKRQLSLIDPERNSDRDDLT